MGPPKPPAVEAAAEVPPKRVGVDTGEATADTTGAIAADAMGATMEPTAPARLLTAGLTSGITGAMTAVSAETTGSNTPETTVTGCNCQSC